MTATLNEEDIEEAVSEWLLDRLPRHRIHGQVVILRNKGGVEAQAEMVLRDEGTEP